MKAYRTFVSEYLLTRARQSGLYMDPSTVSSLGDLLSAATNESRVYVNYARRKVYKVKDPFAASGLKENSPEDALYEHIIHNIFFPDTRYTLIGVTEEAGRLRFVLCQDYVESVRKLSAKESEKEMTLKGFSRKNAMFMENKYVKIADLTGQNALIREDGTVAFVDPLISNKMPARKIIDEFFSMKADKDEHFGGVKRHPLIEAMKRIFVRIFLLGDKQEERVEKPREVNTEDNSRREEEAARKIVDDSLTEEQFRRMLLSWDETALTQLQRTGRYEGCISKRWKKGADEELGDLFIVGMSPDGRLVRRDCLDVRNRLLDRFSEGEINYDGLRFFLTPRQINEMAVGLPVELKCKETGEYSTFVFDAARNEIVCKPSFEKTLKEKLFEDEAARKKNMKEDIEPKVAKTRTAGIRLTVNDDAKP